MNTVITTPEVKLFVRAVRERLTDLTEEEREELVGGLDADMSDLVAEHGVDALPEPADYAAELRSAAGFSAVAAPARTRRGAGERVTRVLDASHARWEALVAGLPGDPWGLVQVLRPAWWVLRAWVALELVDLLWGRSSLGLSPLPSFGVWSVPALVVAVLLSVQVGRGRLWPGGRRGALPRLVLLALNVLALAYVPITFANVGTPASMAPYVRSSGSADRYEQGYADASQQLDRAGMYVDGRWVSNIYPYDAAGHPIVGVQLFDQTGRPVTVTPQTECVYDAQEQPLDQARVYYPWATATGQVRNVFPVPSRVQGPDTPEPDPNAFLGATKPQVGAFPLPSVPAAGLPGLAVSTATTPKDAVAAGPASAAPINPVVNGC